MTSTALELIELGAVFFGAGRCSAGWPAGSGCRPIPLYLIGGVCFGTGGIVPLGDIGDFTTLAGEVGVVLLLLLLGLEYTAAELIDRPAPVVACRGARHRAQRGAGRRRGARCWAGARSARSVLGGVTYISSSGIVAKVLADLGRLGNRETPVMLSILVFEDLAMAVYLPILTAVLVGVSVPRRRWRRVGDRAAPWSRWCWWSRCGTAAFVSAIVDSPDREVFLLKVLGAALLVAGIASALQVSAAVGAFLLGIAISGSTAENATTAARAAARPVRRGVLRGVRPEHRPGGRSRRCWAGRSCWPWSTTVTKLATGWWAAQRQGIGTLGRARAGAALVARGEFSIVIAGLAVAAGGGRRASSPRWRRPTCC